jgi:hypothetical protein
MHDLEQLNIPLIGNLMQDVALSLNGLQQYRLTTWAVKMAMVGDFLARSHRPLFFGQAEREQLRVATDIPMRTTVWIARYLFPGHIGFWGTNSWSIDKSVHAFITTVLVGHLALQVVNVQDSPQLHGMEMTVTPANGPRPWPQLLTAIWPNKVSAQWPPQFSFGNDGPYSIAKLVRRYSYGKSVI